MTARWRNSVKGAGILVAVLIGAASAVLIYHPPSDALVEADNHTTSIYDGTAPSGTTVADTVCVANRSGQEPFDESYWVDQIVGWLNEAWGPVGASKVSFVASSCGTPDPSCDPTADDDPELDCSECFVVNFCLMFFAGEEFDCYCSGAGGCAGYPYGTVTTDDEDQHPHSFGRKALFPVGDWPCDPACDPNNDKRRLINHEVGHNLGLTHDGPEYGRVGDGGLWDGDHNYNTTPGEIDAVRAHLDGEPARPVSPCVGFPETDRVHVSWFDAATDETQHRAELYRIANDPPIGNVLDMEQGEAAEFGSRVTFLSGPRSDVTDPVPVVWLVDPQVYGGPRNQWNSNTNATYSWASGLGWPSRPCTLKVEATGPLGQIQLTWEDASYDETEFAVYYQYPSKPDGWQRLDENGWTWAGTIPAGSEAFADSIPNNQFLQYGERVCAKVVALKSAQASFDSNYACVTIPGDWDGDGFTDDEDWCPETATQSPGSPGDDDCDGFTTTIEDFVGTDPLDPCADSATAGDEADDKWPVDMNDDQQVNSFDLIPYIGKMNSEAPGPPYTVRLDLNMDARIDSFDLIPFIGKLNTGCDP